MLHCIGGVIVKCAHLECGTEWLDPWSDKTRTMDIGCFSAKHTILKGKLKIRIMCQSGITFIPGNLFQWVITIKIHLSVLVKCKADIIIISLKCNLFSPGHNYKIAHLALNNNHSLIWCSGIIDCRLLYYCSLFRQCWLGTI